MRWIAELEPQAPSAGADPGPGARRKDAKGEWQHTQTFYQSDLLPASWAIAKAYEWIVGEYQSED